MSGLGTSAHRHDWHVTGRVDTGHQPPRHEWECACGEREWTEEPDGPLSGPAEAAVEAAAKTFSARRVKYAGGTFRSLAVPALEAAHDPKLGPDRSVTLGAVVDWLRAGDESLAAIIAAYRDGMPEHAADYVAAALERHFSELSS